MTRWIKTNKALFKVEAIQGFHFFQSEGCHFAGASYNGDPDGWRIHETKDEREAKALRAGLEALVEWEVDGWFPEGWKQGDPHPFDAPIITIPELVSIGLKG